MLMGGLCQKMGLPPMGMGGMPDLSKMDPKELAALQQQAEKMGLGGGMPKLPGLGGGLPGLGGPKLPGLPGLPKGPKK